MLVRYLNLVLIILTMNKKTHSTSDATTGMSPDTTTASHEKTEDPLYIGSVSPVMELSTRSTENLGNETRDNSTGSDPSINVRKVDKYELLTIVQATVIGAIGILGNGIVICVIAKYPPLREKLTNYLIINQSVIDFLASVFLLLTRVFDNNKPLISDNHVLMVLHCFIWRTAVLSWWPFVASTFNLIAISVERFVAIVYPITYRNSFQMKKIVIIIIVVWFFGLVINVASLFATRLIGNSCEPGLHWINRDVQKAYGIFRVCFIFFIPLGIMIYCYGRMVYTVYKHLMSFKASKEAEADNNVIREERMVRAQANLLQTLLLVSVSFVICWGPNQIYYFLYNVGLRIDPYTWHFQLTVVLMNINCCINPFLYTWKYREFQLYLKQMFCLRPSGKSDDLEKKTTQQPSKATSEMSVSGSVSTVDTRY